MNTLTQPGIPQTLLADGTPLASLIDRERREVASRVFSDPEIYQLELEHIFAKSWIVLGHESEIPNVGDFVTRKLAEDPVILVRQRDGSIDCLLNVCPHRGAIVCREEAGNGAVFRCIYHGWVFGNDGSFRGAPFKEQMYPGGCDTSQMGLRKARVETFAGIIFANFDESAPSLDEFLGGFKWYLNTMLNRTKAGMEVLGPPQRFVIHANWKTAAEQFAGDGYHAGQLHRTLGLLTGGNPNNPRDFQMHAPKVGTDNAHNVICMDWTDLYRQISPDRELSTVEKLNILLPPGVPREMLPEMMELFSEQELEFLANTPPSNGGMFPNVGVWDMNNPLPEGAPGPFVSFRTYVPLGPDKFEFCMWVLTAKGSSTEYRDHMLRATSFSQGAAGYIEGDDAEVWPGQSMAARGFLARQTRMKYWAQAPEGKPEGWPGPDNIHVYTEFMRDDTQWNWWNHYFDQIGAKA
jgi:phenylpropionate dioxygenase-like ring-hydroxylating dioxygenase large terminal subunit